jgi:tripartite-type tricarboxylate transporter receptor subunit TctC
MIPVADHGCKGRKNGPAVSLPVHVLLVIVACSLIGCGPQDSDGPGFPRRPIKLIVPFGAGGGSDTFGRIIQNAIETNGLLPQPMVIINVPGAGGTIGSRRVKNAPPDGYTLLLLHEGMMTARHCGSTSYGPEAFTPVAGTGNATQVIAVGESSPHQNLVSLMDAAERHPDTIVFSANIGAPSHFAGLMLESEKPGAAFRYTQTGGGAKRLAALQGGHVEVSAFSIAEYIQFKPSGLRALALLGAHRHVDLPALATAGEQGFDVISENMQFWWAPLGTPSDRIDVIADALVAAMATPEVGNKLAEMSITDVTLRDEPLRRELLERGRRIASVAPSSGIDLPDFSLIAMGCLICTGLLAWFQSGVRRNTGRSATTNPAVPAWRESENQKQLAAVGLLTILYVAFLQFRLVGFVPATVVYAMAVGGVLALPLVRAGRIPLHNAMVILVAVTVIMSVVMHSLFTKILVVDLP